MNAVVIEKQGAPVAPNIRAVRDFAEPASPRTGEALVRVEASALNHMDLWVGMGLPGVDRPFPRVTGCDVCGVVEAVCEGVDHAWVGRRVIMNAAYPVKRSPRPDDPPASTFIEDLELVGEHVHGAHRERFCAPVSNLAAVGEADPVQAAAFGLVTLTAYSMMITKAKLRPGQSVLITGIGGGVSTAALAIAKWMGCPVCVTSRHAHKLGEAERLGADWVVQDRGSDWSKEARAFTHKRGFDLVVDSVGKATHLACIKCVARGGAYVTPGATTGGDATTDLTRIFWNQIRLLGSSMGSNEEFHEIAALFRAGQLKPVVDKVYPWTDARSAWERLEAGEQFGKIVLKW